MFHAHIMMLTALFMVTSVALCCDEASEKLDEAVRIAQSKNDKKATVMKSFVFRVSQEACYVAQQFKDGSCRTDVFTFEDQKPVFDKSNATQKEFKRINKMKEKTEKGSPDIDFKDKEYVRWKDLQSKT